MENDNNFGFTSLTDPFKERLLNPFIFSLVVAFIARYRIELYDLLVTSNSDSDKLLNSLTLLDLRLWLTVGGVIVVYLGSIGLGSLVSYAKEYIQSKSDTQFKKIIPVSSSEHELVMSENRALKEALVREKKEIVSSSDNFADLFIHTLKGADNELANLEIIMPHHRDHSNELAPFAYAINQKTKYSYSIFNLPHGDVAVCFPILQSGAGHLICIKFKINNTKFIFNINNTQIVKETIEVPTKYMYGPNYRRWAQPHYFDESSDTWTTTLPSRQRSLVVKLNAEQTSLQIAIVENPNYQAEQGLKNLLGVKF